MSWGFEFDCRRERRFEDECFKKHERRHDDCFECHDGRRRHEEFDCFKKRRHHERFECDCHKHRRHVNVQCKCGNCFEIKRFNEFHKDW